MSPFGALAARRFYMATDRMATSPFVFSSSPVILGDLSIVIPAERL